MNTRQLCLIVGGLFPLGKLILLPATLAYFLENSLYLPPLILFLLESLVLLLVLSIAKKTDKSLFTILTKQIGLIGAKIVFGLYGVFFFLSALLPIFEQSLFLRSAFYDTVPSPLFFIAFFLVCIYLCTKPFKTLGRVSELLVPISSVALLLLLILSCSEASYCRILPIGLHLEKLPLSTLRVLPRFTDALFPLFLLGQFRYEKGMTKKVLLSFWVGCLAVILFLLLFYALYGAISPRQSCALSKVGRYFPAVDTIGRIDLILVYLVSGSYFFYLMFPLFFSTKCLSFALSEKYEAFIGVFLSALVFLLYVVQNYTVIHMEELTALLSPLYLALGFVLPFLLWRRKYA